MRPILRPGCHVLRRNRHELQIGLDPAQAVVLPDDDDVRATLARLELAAEVTKSLPGSDRTTLQLLAAHDLLVDSDRLLPLLPVGATSDHRRRRCDVAALARGAGDGVADSVAARRALRVTVAGFGSACGDGLLDELAELLLRAGITTRTAPPPDHTPSRLGVLVGVGEPPREMLDGWMRDGVPHLVVRLVEGLAVLGPFVRPGLTACLRCLDAHHADADGSWPLLVQQYTTASAGERADGVPEPVDSLTATVLLSWAAREVANHAEGHRPATWSTTIRLDRRLTSVETRSWLRHPDCGCGWE